MVDPSVRSSAVRSVAKMASRDTRTRLMFTAGVLFVASAVCTDTVLGSISTAPRVNSAANIISTIPCPKYSILSDTVMSCTGTVLGTVLTMSPASSATNMNSVMPYPEYDIISGTAKPSAVLPLCGVVLIGFSLPQGVNVRTLRVTVHEHQVKCCGGKIPRHPVHILYLERFLCATVVELPQTRCGFPWQEPLPVIGGKYPRCGACVLVCNHR